MGQRRDRQWADLLVGRTKDATLAWLAGHGDGSFDDPEILGVGAYPTALGVADFDRGGFDDIAVAGGPVAILSGTGNGGFDSPVSYLVLGTQAMAIDDFDGNGLPDAALLNVNFEGGIATRLNARLGALVPDTSVLPPWLSETVTLMP